MCYAVLVRAAVVVHDTHFGFHRTASIRVRGGLLFVCALAPHKRGMRNRKNLTDTRVELAKRFRPFDALWQRLCGIGLHMPSFLSLHGSA
jgi:hypothetical protein